MKRMTCSFYLATLLIVGPLFSLERDADLGNRIDFQQIISRLEGASHHLLCPQEQLPSEECNPLIRFIMNKQKFESLFLNSPWVKQQILTSLENTNFALSHSSYPQIGPSPIVDEENWNKLSITEKLLKGAIPVSNLEERLLRKALTSYGLEGEDNTSSWNPATRVMASQIKNNLHSLNNSANSSPSVTPIPPVLGEKEEATNKKGGFFNALNSAWGGITSVVGTIASAGKSVSKATVDLSKNAAINYFNTSLHPTKIDLQNIHVKTFDFSDLQLNQKVDANNKPQLFISVKINKLGVSTDSNIQYFDFKTKSMKFFDKGKLNLSYDKREAPFVINVPLAFDEQGELSFNEFMNKKMTVGSKFPFEHTKINYEGKNETLNLLFQHIDHGNIGKDLKKFFIDQSLDNVIEREVVKAIYNIDQIKDIVNNKFTLSDFMPKRFTDDQRILNLEKKIKDLSSSDNDIIKGKKSVKDFMEGVEYPLSETMVKKLGELYFDTPVLFGKYDSIIKQMLNIIELDKKNENTPLSIMPEITNDIVNPKQQHLNLSLKRTQCRSASPNYYLGEHDAVINFDFKQINKKLEKLHQENRLDFCLMISSQIRSCKNAKVTNIASKITFDKAPQIEWDSIREKNVIVFKGIKTKMNGLLSPLNWTPFNKFDLKIALNPKSGRDCQQSSLTVANHNVCIAPEIIGPKPTIISTIMGSDFLAPIFDTIFHPAIVEKMIDKFTLKIPTGTYNVDLPSNVQMLNIGQWRERAGKMTLALSFNNEFNNEFIQRSH